MKSLFEFNTSSFPRFLDGKTFRDKGTYIAYLLDNGYAYDSNAPKVEPKEVVVEVPKSPLSEESVDKMFDAIEAKAKADFAVRRRGPNKVKQEMQKAQSTTAIESDDITPKPEVKE